jgi:YesN/AraC family two-component response regulator
MQPLFAEECVRSLKRLMENEKLYRDENISLQTLAERLTIKPHQLSQVINEKLGCKFPDFINSYRIQEAKEIFRSLEGAEKKITAVAHDVGFNSITSFYKAFKKDTRMTPTQYKKGIATPPYSKSV